MATFENGPTLEFAVDDAAGTERIFKTFNEAAGFAVGLAAGNGTAWNIDVLAYSEADARAWSGDYGVDLYREDPDASVFDRIVVRADNLGRVP